MPITKFVKHLFVIDSHKLLYWISPDIQGNMIESLMLENNLLEWWDTSRLINLNSKGNIKSEHYNAYEQELKAKDRMDTNMEPSDWALLMQIYKIYSKDINVVDWYEHFKRTLKTW